MSQPHVSQQSTLPSCGTTPDSEYYFDVWNVTCDLQSTQKVEFHDMLKMFIKRRELGASWSFENHDVLKVQAAEKRTEFDKMFKVELQNAVDFCNLAPCPDVLPPKAVQDKKRRCEEIKWYLQEYCSKSKEIDRCLPLVIILNNILRWMDDEPKLIFIVNDPVIVQLENKFVPKRKPDILLIKLESFKSWFQDCECFTFDDCQTLVTKNEVQGKLKNDAKPSWPDIIQFWELRREKDLNVSSEQFDVNDMISFLPNQAQKSTNQNESFSTNGKRNRKSEESNSSPNERSRSNCQTASATKAPKSTSNESHHTASDVHSFPPETVPAISKDVQCAYYAIEGLRSSWKVSHFSGILLTDTALDVLWYDAQGCLMSHSLDIVKYLPLLLVLVKVQVQSNYLSGFRDIRLPEPYGSYELSSFTDPLFQLTGRRTCHAFLTSFQDDMSSAVDECFFKVSWPEDTRDKEHEIIKDAQKRVELLLPQHRGYVLHHLPDIKDSVVVPDTCTAIVRVLANCPPEATECSRSLYWTISKKLRSLASVVRHFDKFKKIYMELIRCHRLLWTIGIAHCDISFSDLMYDEGSEGPRGILNDFDLAAKMNPGDLSPPKTDFRRAGTKIFMAMPLLEQDALDGKVPRLYRHDLESFAWVLLYACVCVDPNGQECLGREPILEWHQADHVLVGKFKTHFLLKFARFLETHSGAHKEVSSRTLVMWLEEVTRVSMANSIGRRLALLSKDPASQVPFTIEALLHGVLTAWGWTVEEHDWVTFVVKQKDKS